jgi:hypothetical protein
MLQIYRHYGVVGIKDSFQGCTVFRDIEVLFFVPYAGDIKSLCRILDLDIRIC